MISILAGMMLQAAAPPPAPPPPPPPPPAKGKARAHANLGSLIADDDYPAEALRNGVEGVVAFRLLVGLDGRVTDCTITSSSGSEILDSTTCRLLSARARFSPARNKKGRPVADSVAARIVWRIAAGSTELPVAPTLIVGTMRATLEGDVSCTVAINGRPPRSTSCPARIAARMRETAFTSGGTVERVALTIITPAGEVEPTGGGEFGTLIYETEVVLSVAADGNILACRLVRNATFGPAAGDTIPPDPCEDGFFKPGSRKFKPAAQGSAPRALTVKLRGYGRF